MYVNTDEEASAVGGRMGFRVRKGTPSRFLGQVLPPLRLPLTAEDVNAACSQALPLLLSNVLAVLLEGTPFRSHSTHL